MTSRPAARHGRRQALHDHKRQAILGAARAVFLSRGLAGTTMRAIADAAGYVAGAVYAYFPTKEAIVGELLVQSLGNLSRAVKAAGSEAGLQAAAGALWAHYRSNPGELSLALALLADGGAGLPPETGRQINGRLIALLQALAGSLRQEAGMPPPEAERAAVTLLATLAGLLLLQASGRLAMLGQDGDALVASAIERLLR
ncbi:MAG TPA: helix-turn-helix domain-containing protein [Candidatus Sulfotelmatobacter sp.]|nr:helix-turn-helix domain-containing protein [Candidatus Sulfotelmatobacter sp.]